MMFWFGFELQLGTGGLVPGQAPEKPVKSVAAYSLKIRGRILEEFDCLNAKIMLLKSSG